MISESLVGKAVALSKGEDLVLDVFPGANVVERDVEKLVREFVSRRKEPDYYSVELDKGRIVVRSQIGFGPRVKKFTNRVPPGVHQCPACGVVLGDEPAYLRHLRIHDLLRGA